MDGDKKKQFSHRVSCLSLTRNGESGEEKPSDADDVFVIKGSQTRAKVQKTSEASTSKKENLKSPVTTEEKIQKQGIFKSPSKDFCPICQVPLSFIKIPVELHTAHCLIDPEFLPACPDGTACVSTNMFHYRDFNHNELASWRCSADYIPPDSEYPVPPKFSKKRPSLSPLSLASKAKKTRTPENEQVDDPRVLTDDVVRKVLFKEESKQGTSGIVTPKHTEAPIKEKIECDSSMNDSYDGHVPVPPNIDVPTPQKTEVKPLKCDVIFEYSADEAPSKTELTELVGKQSACSLTCLSPTNGDELQAVCTVCIKSPKTKPQDAAIKSPVQVNLLLNESGWEAVQVDGSSSAKVQEIDISLCKCARAMTFKCLVADPKIRCCNRNDVKIEHKYSVVLDELGLKKKTESPEKAAKSTDAHEKVDNLKNKNAQLTIKSFFTSGKDEKRTAESTKVPIQTNGDVQPKQAPSLRPARPKTPVMLLAGSSASRPLTPIAITLAAEPLKTSALTSGKRTDKPTVKPRKTWGNSKTPVPQYKRIPGAPFVVDAFKWGVIDGVKAYFLSHFHSDHYIGLTKHFNQHIYCSRVTANLIQLKIGVDPKFIQVLDIGEPRVVCNVEVEVLDANHCPGSLMFLFRLLDGRTILHVGDFRASSKMEQKSLQEVDILYLDTTYCDPRFDFPSQENVVKEIGRTAKSHLQQNPKTLFCCGSYTIGKERVFLNLAEELDCKFWAPRDKARVLECLGTNQIIVKRFVSDRALAKLYVFYMKDIKFENLERVLKDAGRSYTSLVAFEPTGWAENKVGSPGILTKKTRGNITIYGAPYSEHSNFSELRRFVRFVRPKKIQVTVNLGQERRYQKYFGEWLGSTGGEQPKLDAFLMK